VRVVDPKKIKRPTPVSVVITCLECPWKPEDDECPMCAQGEHEAATGHNTYTQIVSYP